MQADNLLDTAEQLIWIEKIYDAIAHLEDLYLQIEVRMLQVLGK
jgi:hypothetical protein